MRSLLILMALYCQGTAASLFVGIQYQPLDYPTYINYSKADIKLEADIVKNDEFSSSQIHIRYMDSKGDLYDQTLKLAPKDILKCIQQNECLIENIVLENHLFARACKLIVSVENHGTIIGSNEKSWGRCQSYSNSLSKDISLDDTHHFLKDAGIGLPEELGPFKALTVSGLSNHFELYAVGIDAFNNPVWEGRVLVNGPQKSMEPKISPFVYSKLCEVVLIADYKGKIEDRNLENNSKKIQMGKCLQVGSDRLPDIKVISKDEKLYVVNLNDAQFSSEAIGLSFSLFDSNGNQGMTFARDVPGMLNYKEFSVYNFQDLLGEKYCKLLVEANYNHSTPEEDYSNNQIIINKCE